MRVDSLRLVAGLVAAAVTLVAVVDGGSVALTRIQVDDEVRGAGTAAAAAVRDRPATREAAVDALAAARESGRAHGLRVRAADLTLFPDGRVRLTGSRTAPTLLLQRVPRLQVLAEASTTATVEAPLHP